MTWTDREELKPDQTEYFKGANPGDDTKRTLDLAGYLLFKDAQISQYPDIGELITLYLNIIHLYFVTLLKILNSQLRSKQRIRTGVFGFWMFPQGSVMRWESGLHRRTIRRGYIIYTFSIV